MNLKNSNELTEVISTLSIAEEDPRKLDEFVDLHCECIGTLRKYLLEGIKQYIFGDQDVEKSIITFSAMQSALRGICCSYGHVIFPINGLGQLFYRLLSHFFAFRVQFKLVYFSDCEFIGQDYTSEYFINEMMLNKNYTSLVLQELVLLKKWSSSLCIIIKLISSEDGKIFELFTNETIQNIYKLAKLINESNCSTQKTYDCSQIQDLYSHLLNHLRSYIGWPTGLQSPIAIRVPNDTLKVLVLLGSLSIQILSILYTEEAESHTRYCFIEAWICILKNVMVLYSNYELIAVSMHILENLTLNYKLWPYTGNIMLLNLDIKLIEELYASSIFDSLSINNMWLPSFEKKTLVPFLHLIGEFTVWALNTLKWQFPLKLDISLIINSEYNKTPSLKVVKVLLKIIEKWQTLFLWSEFSLLDGYVALLTSRLYSTISTELSDEISNIIFTKIRKDLLPVLDNSNINNKYLPSRLKIRALENFLIKLDIPKLTMDFEFCEADTLVQTLGTTVCGLHEMYTSNISNHRIYFFIAHIQIVLSKYFDCEALLVTPPVIYTKYLIIHLTLEMARLLIKKGTKNSFELGLYLMNHFCRLSETVINLNNLSNWTLSQLISLVEISIRLITVPQKVSKQMLLSFIDIVSIKCTFTSFIIWNYISNVLYLYCIESEELDNDVTDKLLLKIGHLSADERLSQAALFNVLKPLSILLLADLNHNTKDMIIQELNMTRTTSVKNTFEAEYPFGSNYDSLSVFHYQEAESDYPNTNYFPVEPNCWNCKEQIDMMDTILNKDEIYYCSKCLSPLPTSIDIGQVDDSNNLDNYWTIQKLALYYKKTGSTNNEHSSFLLTKILELIDNVPYTSSEWFFSSIASILSLSSVNCNISMKIKVALLIQASLSHNLKIPKLYQIQLLRLLNSPTFVLNFLTNESETFNNRFLASYTKMPPPITIIAAIDELRDPITLFYRIIFEKFKLSIIFGPTIGLYTTKHEINDLEVIIHPIFGPIFALDELIIYISSNNINSQKVYMKFMNLSRSMIYPNLLSQIQIDPPFSSKITHLTKNSKYVVPQWIYKELITNISDSFAQLHISNLVAIYLNNLQNIKILWMETWILKSYKEYSIGFLPINGKNIQDSKKSTNYSYQAFVLLSYLSSILMNNKTTISSLAISPGFNSCLAATFMDIFCTEGYNKYWSLLLLGSSYDYLLPHLLYTALPLFVQKPLLPSIIEWCHFMPNIFSYDKLIAQLAPFIISHLNTYNVPYTILCNLSANNINFFEYLISTYYSQVLQKSSDEILFFPQSLICICTIALLWGITCPHHYFWILYDTEENSTGFNQILKFFIEDEGIAFRIEDNFIFNKQYLWLTEKIELLICNKFTSKTCESPSLKKKKLDKCDSSVISGYSTNNHSTFKVDKFLYENFMWILEYYSKSIFNDKSFHSTNSSIHLAFLPVSFIVTSLPLDSKNPIYWYRVLRSISLLLFISKGHIKKYAMRLFEFLMKATQLTNLHPTCLESWYIYINSITDTLSLTGSTISNSSNIFLQLVPAIIDILLKMLLHFNKLEDYGKTHTITYTKSCIKDLFSYILETINKIDKNFLLLVPIISAKELCCIRRLIMKYLALDSTSVINQSDEQIDIAYEQYLIDTFARRIDMVLLFLTPNAPHITYEKLLGSIKDLLFLHPIDSYWVLYSNIDNYVLLRLHKLYEHSLRIISTTGSDSLSILQREGFNNGQSIKEVINTDELNRYNIFQMSSQKENLTFVYSTLPRKISYSIEKSMMFLRNIAAILIGTIGAIGGEFHLQNYINNTFQDKTVSQTLLNSATEPNEYNNIPIMLKTSIFVHDIYKLTISLLQDYLITYAHWNVAAYAIQESLKYIGCHYKSNKTDSPNTDTWNKFRPEIQELLEPYRTTEYRILEGTKDHILSQLRSINSNKIENVYEFYFWCIDKINEATSYRNENYVINNTEVPKSIKSISILLEGCRLAALGIPSVFNYILPIVIECIILLCPHSDIRMLKEKLCSLVISGLQYNVKEIQTFDKKSTTQKSRNISCPLIHSVTYESIFIVITNLMELYEYLLQRKVPNTLSWFSESLLEPYLQNLYNSELDKRHHYPKKSSLSKDNEKFRKSNETSEQMKGVSIPSNITLSLLAEATNFKGQKHTDEITNSANKQLPGQDISEPEYNECEISRYIFEEVKDKENFDERITNSANSEIKNIRRRPASNIGDRFLSSLSNRPIIPLLANLQFLIDVPISILAQAALSCGAYTRALLLIERSLLMGQTISETIYRRKSRRINNSKGSRLMNQFGLNMEYAGNAIDYLGTHNFPNIQFDPLNPLGFYSACFNYFNELDSLTPDYQNSASNHILYLLFRCYFGVNDIDNLLGIMKLNEDIHNGLSSSMGKDLVQALLKKDYLRGSTIYEHILTENRTPKFNHIFIYKSYFRCLLNAGLPQIVLNSVLFSKKLKNIEALTTTNSIETERSLENQVTHISESNSEFHSSMTTVINNSSLNIYISEALEACYMLGDWSRLEYFLSNTPESDFYLMPFERDAQSDQLFMDLFIPTNLDRIFQKFDVYRGKLLLHLHYLQREEITNKLIPEIKRIKIEKSFHSNLEKARNLVYTQLSTAWKDSYFRSFPFLEKLHILMDIEFIFIFLTNSTNFNSKLNSSTEKLSSKESEDEKLTNINTPKWFRIAKFFVDRVDNIQGKFETKYRLLANAKLTLEMAGYSIEALATLLVLTMSKMSHFNYSQTYSNFLESIDIHEPEYRYNVNSINSNTCDTANVSYLNSNISQLCISDNSNNFIPGAIQIHNCITPKYIEFLLIEKQNSKKTTWTYTEMNLISLWESSCDKCPFLVNLNRNLLISYLNELFNRNQVNTALYVYKLCHNANLNKHILNNSALAELDLIYLRWAIQSSMISSESIISAFSNTIKFRPSCERTYFQFATYLDHYFHLIISNRDSDCTNSTTSLYLDTPASIYCGLGSVLQCDVIIYQCILMYLNTLKYGNSFTYSSLSRILFLMFNHSPLLIKRVTYSNRNSSQQPTNQSKDLLLVNNTGNIDSLTKIKNEISQVPSVLWFTVLPQLLSRCQHSSLGTCIIQPLIARILRQLPHQAAWYFVAMLKSNCSDRKNTAINILNFSKLLSIELTSKEFCNNDVYISIIEDYISIFEGLTILAMDMSSGNSVPTQLNKRNNRSSSSRISNRSLSLRVDFQSLYHSISNINKTNVIIPIQKQLYFFDSSLSQNTSMQFASFLPNVKQFISTQRINSAPNDKWKIFHYSSNELITITGMEDIITVLSSKQKPKRIGIIGNDGHIYYYLVKSEKRGDLRKDMRLMELARIANQRMTRKDAELHLRTFCVIPLSEVAGIIEWVPNVVTLRSLVTNEWKEIIGPTKFHRQLLETQDILRQNSTNPEKLYKIFCEDILPRYPPVLHNWFFKQFSVTSSYNWLQAKQLYTKSTAAWSMFGYIVGLGDRHAENILIDTCNGEIIHVDFDCLFGKGFLLEIPEIVPFRLTPNIVIAMGTCGVEGTFTGSCISVMNVFRNPFNKTLIMTYLEAFVHDPLIEWMRPGKTSQILNSEGINIDPASFAAIAKGHSHLRTIHRKLHGMVNCVAEYVKIGSTSKNSSPEHSRRSVQERGLGLSVESQVIELINSAKCKHNLAVMYAGWMPQL
ncbi:phosphatidylinositol 3- and 4-kinase family protein [Cryptosporidium muris RN66]|uniref:Serine/threonine-protein kinase ATR n=1 Tax=Cryptosporidium muris (strain RN66) TaxID=441375 RepID=B6AD14_CRYMR|nr:phosphatidylinositol 3- and 4-kinase family protein [Cryptosporidium muris RN66]EEA06018.1 phosphatidylinositol 3- and 4-kinase family protein [Cryptosporidium muris RN66]|eukprot:XP_002140367.1 phosphatidylinositol 3- and 4-kinase family protein [Cryptosporidium muris RN66]